MVILSAVLVALLGITASGAAAARSTRDLACDVEDGNRYCTAVNHVKYKLNVAGSGSYPEVVGMNFDTGECQFRDKPYSGPLAPFNEPMSVHFRGPIHLKQFAVYAPRAQAAPKEKREDGIASAVPGDDKSVANDLKQRGLNYVQLDSGKLETTQTALLPRSLVWVTDTVTTWTTVTVHANGTECIAPTSSSAQPSVPSAVPPPPSPPAPFRSQAPMVPVLSQQPFAPIHSVSEPILGGTSILDGGQSTVLTSSTAVASISPETNTPGVVINTSTASEVNTPAALDTPSTTAIPTPSAPVDTQSTSQTVTISTTEVAEVLTNSATQPTASTEVTASTSISATSPISSPSSNPNPNPLDGDFHRLAYYHAASQSSSGLVFLGNKGNFQPHFGPSLSYITPDCLNFSLTPQLLSDALIPSRTEFSIFSSSFSSSSSFFPSSFSSSNSAYVRPGLSIPAYQGFQASVYLFEFSMPHDPHPLLHIPHPGDDNDNDYLAFQYDSPAIWFLNSKIPLTQQYGPCSCWEGGLGCGEFDVFEVLSAGEAKAVTSIKAAGAGNNRGDADWLERPTTERGARLAVGFDEAGGVLWVSVLGRGDDDDDEEEEEEEKGSEIFPEVLEAGLVGGWRRDGEKKKK